MGEGRGEGCFEPPLIYPFTELKHSRKFLTTGVDASARRHTSIVCTGGNPGGSGRNTTPGRRISTSVAVTGAMPKPAEISHILI